MPHKLKTLQRYYDDVWTKGDLDALDTLLTADARSLGIEGATPFDRGELRELIVTTRDLLGPIKFTLRRTIDQGDWLSALVEVESEAAHNGAPVRVNSHIMARFDGPLMSEIYSGLDALSMFEHLGLLPENALAVMLAGTRLR